QDPARVATERTNVLTSRNVPELNLAVGLGSTVARGGSQAAAVLAEAHAHDRGAVRKFMLFLPRPGIPDFHVAVAGGRGEPLPVRTVSHAPNQSGMPAKRGKNLLAGGHVPDPHGFILPGRSETLTIRTECHALNAILVSRQGGTEQRDLRSGTRKIEV